MKFFFIFFIFIFLLSVLLLLCYLLSFSVSLTLEDKSCPFECGFQAFSGTNFCFSMPFFMISLMFLLFDVEILLVCFFPLLGDFSFYGVYFLGWVVSLIFLATLYEWRGGILSWL